MGLALSAAVAEMAYAECNCLEFPFKPDPPCFNTCCARSLAHASPQDLQKVLGVSAETAQKIAARSADRTPPESLDDYKSVLTSSEFDLVKGRLQSLKQAQFRTLEGNDYNLKEPGTWKGYDPKTRKLSDMVKEHDFGAKSGAQGLTK